MHYLIITKNKNLAETAYANGDEVIEIPNDVSVTRKKPESNVSDLCLDDQISDYLIQLGVPAHIKGFDYLQQIIKTALNNPGYEKNGVTTIIYPECANHFDSTYQKVERCIRHAIYLAHKDSNDSPLFKKLFPVGCKSPTAAKFIKTVILDFKKQL